MFPVVSLPRTLIRTRSFDVLPSSRFLGQGLCERCQRCIQVPPQFGTRVFLDATFIIPPQFKVSTTQGARWWSERRCNNCHLLSSVDPVLYCYTNATHVPTVLSLVSSAASVFASSLGQFMDCVLHCLASQSGAFTGCALLPQLRCCSLHSSCFISCFDLINSGEQYESIMNHHWLISRFQSPIVHCGSIITPKSMMISHQSLRIINYYTQINDEQAQPTTTRASIISQNNITISQKCDKSCSVECFSPSVSLSVLFYFLLSSPRASRRLAPRLSRLSLSLSLFYK